jgi:hypothetical protein
MFMDDLRMIDALLAKPDPSPEVRARGRERLLAATRRPARKRRFTWPVAAVAASAAAITAVVVGLTSTAAPNGPPVSPATTAGRRVLLAAAVTAAARPAGSGTYWHVKTVYSDQRGSSFIESWTRRDGREYVRTGPGRPVLHGSPIAFGIAGTTLDFTRIQQLPTDAAALKAELTRLLRTRKDAVSRGVLVGGPGRDPVLIDALTDLLARVPAPPGVRAAAFRVIAGLPGVRRVGSAAGWQTLLIHGDGGDMRLVVDPATSLVRGWTDIAPPPDRRGGTLLADQSVSVPTAEWTSSLPAR